MPVLYGQRWSQQIQQNDDQRKAEAAAAASRGNGIINALVGAAVGYLTAGLGSLAMGAIAGTADAAAAFAPSITTLGAAVKGGVSGLSSPDAGTAAIKGGLEGVETGIESPGQQADLAAKRAKEQADLEAVKRTTESKYGKSPQLQAIVTPPAPVKTGKYGMGQLSVATETPANLTTTTTPGTIGTESPDYISKKDLENQAIEQKKLAEDIRSHKANEAIQASKVAALAGKTGNPLYEKSVSEAIALLNKDKAYEFEMDEDKKLQMLTDKADAIYNWKVSKKTGVPTIPKKTGVSVKANKDPMGIR